VFEYTNGRTNLVNILIFAAHLSRREAGYSEDKQNRRRELHFDLNLISKDVKVGWEIIGLF